MSEVNAKTLLRVIISSTYTFTVFKWNVKAQETKSRVSLLNEFMSEVNAKTLLRVIISSTYTFTVFKWNVKAQETESRESL